MLPKQKGILKTRSIANPEVVFGTKSMGEIPWFGVAIDGLDVENSTRKYFPIHFCTDIKVVFFTIHFCTENYSWDEKVLVRYTGPDRGILQIIREVYRGYPVQL